MSKRRERGDYRSIYVVLVDGPDYQALEPHQKLVLITLKLSLGRAQIGVLPAAEYVIRDRTGYPIEIVRDSLAALQAAGWIQYERNVYWIVDGLKYEPSIAPNDAKHRVGLATHVASLPRLGIVTRFMQHYPDWFDGEQPLPPVEASGRHADAPTGETEGPSEALRCPSEVQDDNKTITNTRTTSSSSARAREFVAAANRGLADNPMLRHHRPLLSTSGKTAQAVEQLADVPVDLACTAIYEIAKGYEPGPKYKQPQSLLYFVANVRERHQKASGGPPTPRRRTSTAGSRTFERAMRVAQASTP